MKPPAEIVIKPCKECGVDFPSKKREHKLFCNTTCARENMKKNHPKYGRPKTFLKLY